MWVRKSPKILSLHGLFQITVIVFKLYLDLFFLHVISDSNPASSHTPHEWITFIHRKQNVIKMGLQPYTQTTCYFLCIPFTIIHPILYSKNIENKLVFSQPAQGSDTHQQFLLFVVLMEKMEDKRCMWRKKDAPSLDMDGYLCMHTSLLSYIGPLSQETDGHLWWYYPGLMCYTCVLSCCLCISAVSWVCVWPLACFSSFQT